MNIFIILTAVIASQVYTYVKTTKLWIKYIQFIVNEICLNKVAKITKIKIIHSQFCFHEKAKTTVWKAWETTAS